MLTASGQWPFSCLFQTCSPERKLPVTLFLSYSNMFTWTQAASNPFLVFLDMFTWTQAASDPFLVFLRHAHASCQWPFSCLFQTCSLERKLPVTLFLSFSDIFTWTQAASDPFFVFFRHVCQHCNPLGLKHRVYCGYTWEVQNVLFARNQCAM